MAQSPVDRHGQDLHTRRVDRRRFLATFALGAGLAPVISISNSLSARRTASACFASKRVMDATDFAYLRRHAAAAEVSSFSRATLAGRRVNGQLRFFMTGENSQNAVANWGCPRLRLGVRRHAELQPNYAPAPRATTMSQNGATSFRGSERRGLTGGAQIDLQNLLTSGLYYKNDRIYWTFYDLYNVVRAGRLVSRADTAQRLPGEHAGLWSLATEHRREARRPLDRRNARRLDGPRVDADQRKHRFFMGSGAERRRSVSYAPDARRTRNARHSHSAKICPVPAGQARCCRRRAQYLQA